MRCCCILHVTINRQEARIYSVGLLTDGAGRRGNRLCTLLLAMFSAIGSTAVGLVGAGMHDGGGGEKAQGGLPARDPGNGYF